MDPHSKLHPKYHSWRGICVQDQVTVGEQCGWLYELFFLACDCHQKLQTDAMLHLFGNGDV